MSEGFSVAQVERLTGLGSKTLHFWDRSHFLSPSVEQAHGTGSRRIYSFHDVVALRITAQLRSAGISLQSLRKVVTTLQAMHGLDRPLVQTFLVTNGCDVFAKQGEELLSLLKQPGQPHWAFVVDLSGTVGHLKKEIEQLRSVS